MDRGNWRDNADKEPTSALFNGGGRGGGRGRGGRRGGAAPGRTGRSGGRGDHGHGLSSEHTSTSGPPPPYSTRDAIWQGMHEAVEEETQSTINETVDLLSASVNAALALDGEGGGAAGETARDRSARATKQWSTQVRRACRALSRMQRVSLAFLSDTTPSMAPHIEAVKEQCVEIVAILQRSGCELEGLAFVGYKDWQYGDDHFEVLDFTHVVDKFKDFVASVQAGGSSTPKHRDYPEDVLGGMDKAINALSWPEKSGTRVIFHFGDAPHHGKRYYKHRDDFPNGHPEDPDTRALFDAMKARGIDYYFGRITDGCDAMLDHFDELHGQPVARLDLKNAANMTAAVIDSVSESVSANSEKESAGHGGSERAYELHPGEPEYEDVLSLSCKLQAMASPGSVADIRDNWDAKLTAITVGVKVAPNPFSKGTQRLAYHAQLLHKNGAVENVVFKEFLKELPTEGDAADRARYIVSMDAQSVAHKLSVDFNNAVARAGAKAMQTRFLKLKLACVETEDGTMRYFTSEQLFRDGLVMVKLTNNYGFVASCVGAPDPEEEKTVTAEETTPGAGPARPLAPAAAAAGDAAPSAGEFQRMIETATAFSHFSHQHTGGYLLVADLQGIRTSATRHDKLLLTDPAIHCKYPRFGSTNLGVRGMDRFFATHECNAICKALKLKPVPMSK